MPKIQSILLFVCFIMLGMSCENHDSDINFRDAFMGDYSCMLLSEGPKRINDTLEIWTIDTTNHEVLLSVSKSSKAEQNIRVKIPNIQSPHDIFEAVIKEDSTFYRDGSENHLFGGKFIGADSISMYFEISSNLGSKFHYRGKKE